MTVGGLAEWWKKHLRGAEELAVVEDSLEDGQGACVTLLASEGTLLLNAPLCYICSC